MNDKFTAACVQTNSVRDVAPNIAAALDGVRRARDLGADFILLPEAVNIMEPKKKRLREKVSPEDRDPALAAFRDVARETGAWLLAGSLIVEKGDGMLANRSFLIDESGEIKGRYDKIHMYDVDLGNGEVYRESAVYEPGRDAVLADLPWGKLGMTVCYDLRFPHLYRALAKGGADFLSVPAAFTRTTGRAHWHVLLRARAIESGCFVIAPAQCGDHAEGRQTFGHSLIIDPWGEVLADGGEDVGVIAAEIDPSKGAEARAKIPALTHDRPFESP